MRKLLGKIFGLMFPTVFGCRTRVFRRPDGRRRTDQERLTQVDWPWRDSLQLPGRRYARLTATSPTFGSVTVVILNAPGQQGYDLLCQATTLTAPRLIRAWKRRSWIAHHFRTLKYLLATEVCQVQSEDASTGLWSCGCWLAWSCSTPLADSSRGA